MDKNKILKNIIYIIIFFLLILVSAYGVITSDFSKIKKYDEPDSKRKINSIPMSKEKKAIAKQRYYTTKVKSSGDGMMSLGDFTMNLSNNKILTANISLKYRDKDNSWLSSGKTKGEMLQNSAVLRNSVINALYSSKVRTNSDKIKKDIKDSINRHLSHGEVEEVYFNKFIIQ